MGHVLNTLYDRNQMVVGYVKSKEVEKNVDFFLNVWLHFKCRKNNGNFKEKWDLGGDIFTTRKISIQVDFSFTIKGPLLRDYAGCRNGSDTNFMFVFF